ncbi:MAG TPA: hypothetical protein VHV77_11505, partial [Pirellulales bacterium]|nr:hypothetical protein [Pirellulales bacterium]
TNDSEKKVHMLPIKFTAGASRGKITRKIIIETDLGPDATAEVIAYAQVLAPPQGEPVTRVP